MYNFALIVLSLAYQSPFVGDFSEGKCERIDYIYEVIGFYKYDYGFRITSRSSLVEIVIFMLVSLQSYMFSSQDFDYVSKYLEVEQIDALVREQQKRAAWKTAQLQHIRKSEEQKRLRNLQVEKIKSEMLNLQIQLHSTSDNANYDNTFSGSEGLRHRRNSSLSSYRGCCIPDKEENELKKRDPSTHADSMFPLEVNESPTSVRNGSLSAVLSKMHSMDSLHEITEQKERTSNNEILVVDEENFQAKENPLISAVHFIGGGVSQVQSLGSLAVINLVNFFNIEHKEPNSNEHSSENGVYDEIQVMKNNSEFLEVYQLEDQFPKEFVFILMIIFFLIVVDRIIYLCSFATGKVIFYLFSLVLFTYSVTKYAWHMEPSHQHGGRFALRAIYLTKAISLALQAIQIRYGIPHESALYRQFLTSSVSQINFLGFRLYRALPFLYELRCVLDWSCTTTSLTMYDWLKDLASFSLM
ncbi:hypothetical protein F0562_019837 [Nyssa sinensis]|uniref:Piezo THU9 and anchor domain-containing protein n=1 Tax=Nyssa sinensis TaxID=561372 RepID=A0A5J5BQZ7_9ASTE|nr:hypothetical protein F0562_019837 [Nyssa sinensis]